MYLDPSCCRYDQSMGDLYFVTPWSEDTVRIRAWDNGCAQESMALSGWRHDPECADFPILNPGLTGGEHDHPCALYMMQVPRSIACIIRRYPTGQQALLQLCSASERAIQLLHSIPNFLWFIGPSLIQATAGDQGQIHALLGKSRKALLEEFYDHVSGTMLKLLQKLPVPGLSSLDQRALLLSALADEYCLSVLRHKRKCDWEAVLLLVQHSDILHYSFVRRLFLDAHAHTEVLHILPEVVSMYKDTVRLGRGLGFEDAQEIVLSCSTWHSLRTLHDRWTMRLNFSRQRLAQEQLDEPLSSPPIPGTSTIQPLNTERELLEEGAIMKHCVGAYADAVRFGGVFIYRVLEPERATLEIRLGGSGAWNLAQVRSYCNKAVGGETIMAIQHWLLEMQKSISECYS